MRISERFLWRFIDNDLTAEEKIYVQNCIDTQPSVRAAYEKLNEFHNAFKSFFDKRAVAKPEEPSSGAATSQTIRESMMKVNKRNDPFSMWRRN